MTREVVLWLLTIGALAAGFSYAVESLGHLLPEISTRQRVWAVWKFALAAACVYGAWGVGGIR